jgi:hypothetical protein
MRDCADHISLFVLSGIDDARQHTPARFVTNDPSFYGKAAIRAWFRYALFSRFAGSGAIRKAIPLC